MAFSTDVRMGINRLLGGLGLKLDTLTAERREHARLDALSAAGLFDRPVYALSPGMAEFDVGPIAAAYEEHKAALERLRQPGNEVGFQPDNTYFRTPDMDALYLLVRMLRPAQVVEVGCGHSTRITRQAIRDGALATRLTAIDPWPRNDIAPFVDHFEKRRLEEVEDYSLFDSLAANDILFIDSSHMANLGNDVARLFCDVIPRLKPGVVVHVHDVFLPYEYPQHEARDWSGWGEQYVLHALLQGGKHEILWPGHYLQRTGKGLEALPFLATGTAQSFWFRIGG
ncbi:MAG TPA: class I SAM-dependent methyltransferase [Caulobacter sp.]|nr:class I SAM-dependent methyltransferase [Caulobacter sp.]